MPRLLAFIDCVEINYLYMMFCIQSYLPAGSRIAELLTPLRACMQTEIFCQDDPDHPSVKP